MIAVHIFRSSPKRRWAKLSFYLQRDKVGISWRRRDGGAGLHLWTRRESGEWERIVA